MNWNYITTLKTAENRECDFPDALRNYFRTVHGIDLPADFGASLRSLRIPGTDSHMEIYGSPTSEDVGTLLVVMEPPIKGCRRDFYIYGGLRTVCHSCAVQYDSGDLKFCPKCGKKLTTSI